MRTQSLTLAAIFLCATLGTASAQFGRGGGGMAAPPTGPNLGGANALLFGDNNSFTANFEMQSGSSQPMGGKISVSDGKSRFEFDMTKLASGRNASSAAQLKQFGMDTVASISRPDKKTVYTLYPGLNAYFETTIPDAPPATAGKSKTDISKLGTETIDGHPCAKNKIVVTDDNGATHESTVWNASDLKNFPLKIEQTEGGQKVTMTFKDVKLDKIDASLFEVPSGAKKYDSMMTLMQQEMMSRALRGRGQ
ncbi:MAG TPA: hypothetical protein VFC07_13425 [Verrucomicrobiae bacterium]|nr:hypothetical protein [Verrucomicrobiae bacterium]